MRLRNAGASRSWSGLGLKSKIALDELLATGNTDDSQDAEAAEVVDRFSMS